MKRWLWGAPLVDILMWALIATAPLAWVLWSGYHLEPLSMPLSLRSGEYTSPFFRTCLSDEYQIDIYFLPFNRTPLDLDWKIVNSQGAVIKSGIYRDQQTGGNNALLGHYRPRLGSRQRIIVNIHQGDDSDTGSDTRLHIGLPERNLGQGYAFIAATVWAAIVLGAGLLLLLIRWSVAKPHAPPKG